MNVRLAVSDTDIACCYAVMRQLRPHLGKVDAFVAQARRHFARKL